MATWFNSRNWRGQRRLSRLPSRKHSSRCLLRAEVLEDRLLPSLSPALLRDINPGNASSFPGWFADVNGTVVGCLILIHASQRFPGQ
jgi:hypothetical protein